MRSRRAPTDWPALERLLFAGALLFYALCTPLGLVHPTSGLTVAEGCALDGARGGPPLALLAIRLFAFLPVGDLATRSALASAVAAALAVALLGRLAALALTCFRTGDPSGRPRDNVRWAEPGTIYPRPHRPRDPVELVAVLGATGVAAVSLDLFRAGTSAGGGALTLALVVAIWIRALRVWNTPDDARAGLGLALLAGLALGVDAVAVPLAVVPAVLLGAWAAPRARWPQVAPFVFFGGGTVALFALAVGGSGTDFLARLWPARAAGSVVQAAQELGVVGALLAGAGLILLATRAPRVGAALSAVAAGAAWFSGPALLVATGAAVMPLAVGLLSLATQMGRARPAAALALAAIAVMAAGLDGGAARWQRDVRVPERLLERALDRTTPRAAVDAGSAEMTGIFRYATLVGLPRQVK